MKTTLFRLSQHVKQLMIFTLMFALLGTSFMVPQKTQAQNLFKDTVNSPYKESIDYLAMNAIVNGYSDGNFRPDALMNRAEFTKIVIQAFYTSDFATQNPTFDCFNDVKSEWFAPVVCYAKNQQVVNGYADNRFRPSNNVSYVEALAVALRAGKVQVPALVAGQEWYTPYLNFAHTNSIFSKYELAASTPLTRGRAAFIIHHTLLIQRGVQPVATVRRNVSAGCGLPAPSVAPSTLTVSGATQTMITSIPNSYQKDTPIKLVLAFHGRTNSNAMVKNYFRVEQASQGKAIFVYPAGRTDGRYGDAAGSLALFDALVETFSSQYCIDMDNIFVVGHSLGGSIVSGLSCTRGDIIRGMADVGGGGSRQNTCSGPVAAMIWHNPKDNLVSFNQGIIARDKVRQQNYCNAATKPSSPSWAHAVEYFGCTDGNPLVWAPHTEDYEGNRYYPHTWPRAAGAEIWKFFDDLEG